MVVSSEQFMKEAGITQKQLDALIEHGDLPPFTYGYSGSRFKGWHVAVLERHALLRLAQTISDGGQVGLEDVGVMSLRSRNRTMAEKCTDLNDRHAGQKEPRRKKVSKRVGAGEYADTMARLRNP